MRTPPTDPANHLSQTEDILASLQAEADQRIEVARSMADVIATFYMTLKEQHLPQKLCDGLTYQFTDSLIPHHYCCESSD